MFRAVPRYGRPAGLDACRPTTSTNSFPPSMCTVSTFLHWQAWDRMLAAHPNKRFRENIVSGIRDGIRLGFDYSKSCQQTNRNMVSSLEHPQVVNDYLATECLAGRVMGPLLASDFPNVQISPFGVIPKTTSGKWRLILDLSSPDGRSSVNDEIDQAWCSLVHMLRWRMLPRR